jgi:lambda repressor-like predicted transcriptional regulator
MHDMTPEAVKKLILDSGITLSELGIQNGFSSAAVSIALKNRSPFVQKVIADRLGMKPQDIWPRAFSDQSDSVGIPGAAGF